MNTTLKNAVEVFCEGKENYKKFREYLLDILKQAGEEDTILEEGEFIEITSTNEVIVVCFSWDMITVFNSITLERADLANPENIELVFEGAGISGYSCNR